MFSTDLITELKSIARRDALRVRGPYTPLDRGYSAAEAYDRDFAAKLRKLLSEQHEQLTRLVLDHAVRVSQHDDGEYIGSDAGQVRIFYPAIDARDGLYAQLREIPDDEAFDELFLNGDYDGEAA